MATISEEEWAERASAFLKHELREFEVTYVELAKRLKKHGLKETEASITNKLKRGSFPATFFLACIAALELDGVALDEVQCSCSLRSANRFSASVIWVSVSSTNSFALYQSSVRPTRLGFPNHPQHDSRWQTEGRCSIGALRRR